MRYVCISSFASSEELSSVVKSVEARVGLNFMFEGGEVRGFQQLRLDRKSAEGNQLMIAILRFRRMEYAVRQHLIDTTEGLTGQVHGATTCKGVQRGYGPHQRNPGM